MQDDTKQIEEVNVTRHMAKRTANISAVPAKTIIRAEKSECPNPNGM